MITHNYTSLSSCIDLIDLVAFCCIVFRFVNCQFADNLMSKMWEGTGIVFRTVQCPPRRVCMCVSNVSRTGGLYSLYRHLIDGTWLRQSMYGKHFCCCSNLPIHIYCNAIPTYRSVWCCLDVVTTLSQHDPVVWFVSGCSVYQCMLMTSSLYGVHVSKGDRLDGNH